MNVELILQQGNCKLKFLTAEEFDALTAIAADPRIWIMQRADYHKPEVFKSQWLDKAIRQIEQDKRFCWVIYWNDQLAGSSSFYDLDYANKTLSIGWTFYHPNFWGSALNPTVKYVMLQYAFEALKMLRVAFYVDSENVRSCRALAKLGIQQEGVLRRHLTHRDGTQRNSAVFSVIDTDWPEIKENLLKKLASN